MNRAEKKQIDAFLKGLLELSVEHGIWIEQSSGVTMLFNSDYEEVASNPAFNGEKQVYEIEESVGHCDNCGMLLFGDEGLTVKEDIDYNFCQVSCKEEYESREAKYPAKLKEEAE